MVVRPKVDETQEPEGGQYDNTDNTYSPSAHITAHRTDKRRSLLRHSRFATVMRLIGSQSHPRPVTVNMVQRYNHSFISSTTVWMQNVYRKAYITSPLIIIT